MVEYTAEGKAQVAPGLEVAVRAKSETAVVVRHRRSREKRCTWLETLSIGCFGGMWTMLRWMPGDREDLEWMVGMFSELLGAAFAGLA